MALDLREPILRQAQSLSDRHTRRSFLGRLGMLSLVAVGGVTFARQAVALGAPTDRGFKLHCAGGGSHLGNACSGGSCQYVQGGCWYSCCTNLCGGSSLTQFCDCCGPDGPGCDNARCSQSSAFPCYQCKLESCTIFSC